MMVTSDSTPLMAIRTAASTGRPTRTRSPAPGPDAGGLRPATRPATTNTSTGIPIVLNTPSGSRKKILISSQVNLQSPRSIAMLVPDRVTGELEKHILEGGEHRAEVGDPDPVFGQTLDDLGDQVIAPTANREPELAADHRLDSWDRPKAIFSD